MKKQKNTKKRTRVFIVIFIAVILLLLICFIWFYYTTKPKAIESQKISDKVNLEYINAYPRKSDIKQGNYYLGKLYKSGKINVVVLEGSYIEMGKQYGALLKDVLNENYNQMIEGLKNTSTITFEEIQEQGNTYYDTYPVKYQQIVDGLAETSGLGLEKAKFLLSQEDYVYAGLIDLVQDDTISGAGNCSGLAVWNDFSTDSQMIFGRNYDLGPVNHEYTTLTVYNPIDGSLPTANFTFAGGIYVTSGINRDSLFLELNNGSSSDKNSYTGSRPFAAISLFNFLEQSKNMNQLEIFFNSTLPDSSYIINAASTDESYSFEWSTYAVKKRSPDENGVIAATNRFFDPSWTNLPPENPADPDAVIKRKDNLINLANQNKGSIDPAKMMEIIATPLEDGGSFRAPNLTSYEIVTEPSTLKLWLRVPDYQEWTEIDLSQLFNK